MKLLDDHLAAPSGTSNAASRSIALQLTDGHSRPAVLARPARAPGDRARTLAPSLEKAKGSVQPRDGQDRGTAPRRRFFEERRRGGPHHRKRARDEAVIRRVSGASTIKPHSRSAGAGVLASSSSITFAAYPRSVNRLSSGRESGEPSSVIHTVPTGAQATPRRADPDSSSARARG